MWVPRDLFQTEKLQKYFMHMRFKTTKPTKNQDKYLKDYNDCYSVEVIANTIFYVKEYLL